VIQKGRWRSFFKVQDSDVKSCLFFVDAGFLSELSKFFGRDKHLKFNYSLFLRYLASKKGLIVKKIFYYTAPPFVSENPSFEEIRRKRGYDKFISKLRKDNLFIIREGRVQRIFNKNIEIFNQKGVDNLMTLDLAFSKYRFSEIKNLILLTSDSDFVPVIKELRNFNLNIFLYTYIEKVRNSKFLLSQNLINSCNQVLFLKKDDLTRFEFKN
jgi:uncharacterized LabA/DUF88 family protein